MLIALTLSLIPQTQGLDARLEGLKLMTPVTRVLAAAPAARPGSDSVGPPSLLATLRGSTGAAVDPLLERLDLDKAGPVDADLAIALIQRLALPDSFGRRRMKAPARTLSAFEEQLEEAHRDLRGVLGDGLEFFDVLPQVHAMLDQMRGATLATQLDKDQREQLQGVLERLREVERDAVVRLGQELLVSAVHLSQNKDWRARLLRRDPLSSNREFVQGDVLLDRETAFGRLIVGGTGPNTYDCSQVDVIIDLGGDDRYDGAAGATMERRRLGVVLDLDGDDIYETVNDGLGSATYGIGILIDAAGDDTYTARARSLGFGVGGFGAFLDLAGNDKVEVEYHAGGCGAAGLGLFFDGTGDDVRRGGSHSFGLGLPAGVGIFVDGSGDDRNTLGALSIEDERGTADLSFGFGAGVGFDGVLDGGVGLALDGSGVDHWTGKGLILGSGAQGGLGVFVDRSGADRYEAGVASGGAAHRGGIGVMIERRGDDRYTMLGGLSLGAAALGGQGWLVDFEGKDTYRQFGAGLGDAFPGAVAGFVDLDGQDSYHKDTGASRRPPWPARGPATEADSVSLFLDEGTAEDSYRWTADHSPVQSKVRRGNGRGGLGQVVVRVDR